MAGKEATTDILMKCHDKNNNPIAAECPLLISKDDKLALTEGFQMAPPFTAGSFSLVDDFSFSVDLVDKESTEHQAANVKATLPDNLTEEQKASIIKASTGGGFDQTKSEFYAWRSATNWDSTGQDANVYSVKAGQFSINRDIDKASPVLFQLFATQQALKFVTVLKRISSDPGTGAAAAPEQLGYLRIDFGNVIILGIDWNDGEVLKEKLRFEARTINFRVVSQETSGKLNRVPPALWSRT